MAKIELRNKPPKVDKLPDGRLRVYRSFDLLNFVASEAKVEATDVFLAWGTVDSADGIGGINPQDVFASCRLIDQGTTGAESGKPNGLFRVYEELHATNETQVGKLLSTIQNDGRKVATAQFLQFSSASATPGVPGVTTAPGDLTLILDKEVANDNGGVRTITRYYIQATSTVTKVGDTEVSIPDRRAFTGTSSGAVISTTKFAREFTVRYIVAGDGTAAVNWHAVSSVLVIDGTNTYLTGTHVVYRGIAHTTIARVYSELPSTLIYDRQGQYTLPAKLGYSTRMGVYVSKPSTTRQVTFEIEDTYAVGELAAQSLEYEPIHWAEGVLNYTRATGEEGAKAFNFPGAIGSWSVSMTNKIFAGYLCSTVTGTIASDPATYPTGKKRISSRCSPWRGDIWKRTNVFYTFP